MAKQDADVTARIQDAGGAPVVCRGRNGPTPDDSSGNDEPEPPREQQEKTFIDQIGVHRCHLKLGNRSRSNQPITEKEEERHISQHPALGRRSKLWRSVPGYHLLEQMPGPGPPAMADSPGPNDSHWT
ncbi:MAG: hypothetical protein ACE5JL_00480 [Dehalococcoidia bacterium]